MKKDQVPPKICIPQKSKTVEHGTPKYIVQMLADEFADGAFDLDVAASDVLHVCEKYFTKKDNGLLQKWFGRVWCNPPYGLVETLWIQKAVREVLLGRAEVVVMLLPAKMSKKWWKTYVTCEDQDESGRYKLKYPLETMKPIDRRIQFIGSESTATFPCVALVFRAYDRGAI